MEGKRKNTAPRPQGFYRINNCGTDVASTRNDGPPDRHNIDRYVTDDVTLSLFLVLSKPGDLLEIVHALISRRDL